MGSKYYAKFDTQKYALGKKLHDRSFFKKSKILVSSFLLEIVFLFFFPQKNFSSNIFFKLENLLMIPHCISFP